MWGEVQTLLASQMALFNQVEANTYTKTSDGIKVGAKYTGYEVGGNSIEFLVDRALSIEYNDVPFGVLIDLTADKVSGQEAMAMFTIEGQEYVENSFSGVDYTCAA